MKIQFTKSIFFLAAGLMMAINVWGDAVASNELYATYQKHGDRFYKGSGVADPSADYYDWAVNYYIVACGDSILLRATTTEDRTLTAGWQTQLRVWNASGTYDTQRSEIQTDAGDSKNRYTSKGKSFLAKAVQDWNVHMFLDWEGHCTTQTFGFNRASINNPIEDNTAPIIDPNDVTMTEVDGKLVFTFGAVTADDQYFYYVADKDHNVGGISLTNKVYITKPTVEDGTTYTFKCYAVDYNGNKSAYKEFTLAMPFDPELDLARNKSCSAGAVQDANTADRAVNGNAANFWTCFGQGSASDWWWQVDLGNDYNLSEVKIHFNDIWEAYNIYASEDNSVWTAIIENATAEGNETVTYSDLAISGRYLKVTCAGSHIGIKEFEVYASGLAAQDETNPTVSVTCTDKTINSATLKIIAADEDDAGNPGIISSINISGDHGFVTQNNVTLDGENEITLAGLTYNTTYSFTVTVQDSHGNEGSANIEVQLPLNTNFNLAEGKTAVAGKIQGGNVANYGCDGNLGTTFSTYGTQDQSKEYWYVDLEDIYTIRQVSITWGNDYAQHFLIQGAIALPEESVRENDDAWTTYLDYTYASDPGSTEQEHALVGKMRYLRLKSLHNEIHLGINFKELKVYGSDYAELDNTAPILMTKGCTTNTETSEATITLVAEDAVDGAIKDFYISCANPEIAETKYTTNASDQIVIGGLDNTKDYTFDIRFRDLSGNWSTTSVIAHFAMALGTNVAEGKTATAGSTEGEHSAANAVDGNNEDNKRWGNYGQATEGNNWWKVDLVNGFKLTNIAITWQTAPGGGCVIEGSLNDVSYTQITSYNGSEYNTRVRQVLEITGEQATKPYRYIRVRANTQANFMSFYEFEVYASEEIALLSFGDAATDNSDLIAAHDEESANVVLNRTIEADNTWYTLCLPFDMSAEKVNEVFGASTIAELTGAEDRGSLIHLNFDYVDAIVAGKPYLFKAGETFNAGSTIEGVTIKNEGPTETGDELMKFIGTYNQIVLENQNQRFVADDDYLYSPAAGGTTMGAFRCYFTIPGGSSAGAPGKRAKIVFGHQSPTGMDQITEQAAPAKFMFNGVLYIIRDGKTYNAQGQMIQ